MNSLDPAILDLPVGLPALAAVVGALPEPRQAIGMDVLPHHALQEALAFGARLACEHHAPVLEAAGEIEVARGIVGPRLLPAMRGAIEAGEAAALERRSGRPAEFLEERAAIEDLRDAVAAVGGLALVLEREIPFADPEIELLRLG